MAIDMTRKARDERAKTIIANLRAMLAHEEMDISDLRVKHLQNKDLSSRYQLPSRYVVDRTFGRDLNQTTHGWPLLREALVKSVESKAPTKKTDKIPAAA